MCFREDVRVTMATTGLYKWLLRIVNASGVIGEEGNLAGDIGHDEHHKEGKEKDEKKPMLGPPHSPVPHPLGLIPIQSPHSPIPGQCHPKPRPHSQIYYHFALGRDALQLDINVKFPLSLVVSRKTILRYQLLFRFLLHLKHIEEALSAMWLEQQGPVWRRMDVPPEFAAWRLCLFVLRAWMLARVQQILGFFTQEVLQAELARLRGEIVKSDHSLRDHVNFLDTCMKECMVTSSKLLNVCRP